MPNSYAHIMSSMPANFMIFIIAYSLYSLLMTVLLEFLNLSVLGSIMYINLFLWLATSTGKVLLVI